ncbi:MAG: 1,4-dihydroxy-2-naphthoate octaprenyltransferase [Chlamydiia bacterium]|nr:1,4-dihydroxy-2-naphthoate octaprenyltransferase [Chlamydiia bacterium]
MTSAKVWIEATRPKTLIISIAPVLIGAVMAWPNFNASIFFHILACIFTLQIGTNLANDYFDFKKGTDTADRIGPRRLCQSGEISPRDMKIGMVLAFASSFAACIKLMFLGGPIIFYLMCLAIVLGIGYTAGPFPLGYNGLGDLVAFIVFGPIATGYTYYFLSGNYSLYAVIAGIAPGAFAAAIMNLNNLRDQLQDFRAQKKTIPLIFGNEFGRGFFVFTLAVAFAIPGILIWLTNGHAYSILADGGVILALPLLKQLSEVREPGEYQALFPKTIRLLGIYTLLFCIGWIISH